MEQQKRLPDRKRIEEVLSVISVFDREFASYLYNDCLTEESCKMLLNSRKMEMILISQILNSFGHFDAELISVSDKEDLYSAYLDNRPVTGTFFSDAFKFLGFTVSEESYTSEEIEELIAKQDSLLFEQENFYQMFLNLTDGIDFIQCQTGFILLPAKWHDAIKEGTSLKALYQERMEYIFTVLFASYGSCFDYMYDEEGLIIGCCYILISTDTVENDICEYDLDFSCILQAVLLMIDLGISIDAR